MNTGERTPISARTVLLFAAVGVVAAVLGLVPWLITGMRLPLQNLWAEPVVAPDGVTAAPESMPIALLPFSQYALTFTAALLIAGAAVAGLAARLLRARARRGAVVAVLAGVVLTQLVALLQSALTAAAGLQDRLESVVYLAAATTAGVVAIVKGAVVVVLIARAPAGAAVVGLSIGALALVQWAQGLVYPIFSLVTQASPAIDAVLVWLPAVLVAAAIFWAGVSTVGRVIGALVSLLALWIGPAAITAISSAAGTRVYAGYPFEMAEVVGQIFRAALLSPATWRAVVAAAVIAAVGLVLRGPALRRLHRTSPS